MKDNGKTTKETEKAFVIRQTAVDMKAIGKTTKETEKVFNIVQTAIDMKANLRIINLTVTE